MSIDTYKLTSTEEPTDEVLSQLMREAAEEAAQLLPAPTGRVRPRLPRKSSNNIWNFAHLFVSLPQKWRISIYIS